MKFKTMSYGRTIEVGGPFGRGRAMGKVWFGWEVELEEGDDEATVEAILKAKADEREVKERKEHDERARQIARLSHL